jgi:Domain of unknown function (DUF5753)
VRRTAAAGQSGTRTASGNRARRQAQDGVTDPGEIGTFAALVRRQQARLGWHRCDDVLPPWFRTAVGLEESVSLIRALEPRVVFDLLQTEGSIRAITAASFPAVSEDFTERAAAFRLARQYSLMTISRVR